MSEDKKVWRTESFYDAKNVMVMSVGEPVKLSDDKTLCSFSFVDQPGDEKHEDMWVRVTGANQLAERIYNLTKGDRVCVNGKLVMRYYEKDGVQKAGFEIPFARVTFLTPITEKAETEEVEEVEEVEAPVTKRRGRPPGTTTKSKDELPF